MGLLVMEGARRRIQFVETLGRGGFGAVYLADVHSHNDLVQRLAIKILSAEMTEVADVAARQRDEARLLARLNHDNIVKVYDLTELEGRPAVLMEYVEGADASLLLRLGPFPPRAATQLIAAAAAALEAAHDTPNPLTGQPLRVVHRDIKPANLLVSRHGGVKVLDFGIARAEFEREGKTTSIQYGTARYMAPEQWLYGQVSPAVDVYALGVSFVELLTARHRDRPPLERDSFEANLHTLLSSIAGDSGGSSLWYDELNDLLRDMLAFDPLQRPSAGEVHERALTLSERAPGESLARLARAHIPPLIEARRLKYANDPLPLSLRFQHPDTLPPAETLPHTGHNLPSGPTLAQSPPSPSPRRRRTLAVALGLAASAAGLLLVLGLAGAASLALQTYSQTSPPPYPAAADLAPPRDLPPLPPPSPPAPEPEPALAAEPSTPPPTPTPRSTPAPREAVAATTTTTPEETVTVTVAEVTEVEARALRFGGPAIGTAIYLNGQYLGQTPLRSTTVSHGQHQLEMHYGGEVKRLTIDVGANTPGGYSWRAGSDQIVGQ